MGGKGLDLILTAVAAVGGAGVIIIGVSVWLGRVIASHLAQADRSRYERELTQLRSDLERSHATELDALVRKRDVYASIATTMRVFLKGDRQASQEQRSAFLLAYDEGCLWASEAVVAALGDFLDLLVRWTAGDQDVEQHDMQNAYAACMGEMRRDSGFADTEFRYRIVSF